MRTICSEGDARSRQADEDLCALPGTAKAKNRLQFTWQAGPVAAGVYPPSGWAVNATSDEMHLIIVKRLMSLQETSGRASADRPLWGFAATAP